MQKNNIKKSNTPLNDIIVDLGCKNANSNIGKWEINIEPPKRFWIFRKLGLNIKRKIRLYLGDIKADDLKIDANTLLYISLKNEEWAYGEKKDIDIDSLSVYFHVIINPLSILDCKHKQTENGDNRYPISFNICMEDCSTGRQINTIPVSVFIRLTKKSVCPSISIRLNSTKTEYHSGLKNEEIGILTISNDAKFNYNPYVTGKVKLLVYDTERNILVDNIYLKDADDDGYVNFGTLDSGKEKKYGIEANYPSIGNPASMSNKYELTAIYEDEKNTEFCRSKVNFVVERNSAKPQLLVSLQRNQQKESIYITNEETVKWDDKVIDFSNEQDLLKHCFSFQLKNGCKNGLTDTGLIIEDVKCTPKLPILAKEKFHGGKTLDDIFGFSQLSSSILVAGEIKEFEVSFRQNDVVELFTCDGSNKDFNTNIEFIVSFKYWDCPNIQEAKNLPVSLQREFKFTVCMTLYQLPSVNWLAIDYGTSAIACRFAGETLHLRDKKLELWGVKEDPYENGTQYLSSNIIYRNNKTVDKSKSSLICDYEDKDDLPKYKSLAIALSPTVEQEDMNLGFILPCMKMLLGYDYIPNITQYEGYTYNHKSNGNICEQELFLVRDGRVIPSDLCKVNNVMYEVYKELFLYFVKDNIANPLQLNNIILTVPNTFSPNHFLQLRNIINESFKEYNIRNLKFISESDAVACYYYRNWATINRSQEVDRASFMDSLRKEERVLIFDMGAGTLDLTYLIKKDREIAVKGRMGISKAGNYLDGLLASIIAEKENNVLLKICDSSQITDSDHLLAARELKNMIKSKLKPILGMSKATLTLSKSNRAFNDIGMKNDVEVKVDDIVDNPIFQDYLKSCTTDILYNFFTFYNLINKKNARRCVDTVIISGRASKLSFIKEKVNSCFDGFTDSSCFKIIDMSTVMESDDKSKDVVVEGAMAYALQDDMKIKYDNIMANYGILYYDCYGDLKYTEILNPRKCKPVASKIIEGMNIKQYDTEETECDISGCNGNDRPLILLQSYSNNTLNEWKNGNREYITVMSEWRNLQGGTNSLIKIKVDENNQLRLYINNAFTDNLAPSHIDVNSELNKKSMWPFMQK